MSQTWNQFNGQWENEKPPFFTNSEDFIRNTNLGDTLPIRKNAAHLLETTGKSCRDGNGHLVEQVKLKANNETYLADVEYRVNVILITRGSDL